MTRKSKKAETPQAQRDDENEEKNIQMVDETDIDLTAGELPFIRRELG